MKEQIAHLPGALAKKSGVLVYFSLNFSWRVARRSACLPSVGSFCMGGHSVLISVKTRLLVTIVYVVFVNNVHFSNYISNKRINLLSLTYTIHIKIAYL